MGSIHREATRTASTTSTHYPWQLLRGRTNGRHTDRQTRMVGVLRPMMPMWAPRQVNSDCSRQTLFLSITSHLRWPDVAKGPGRSIACRKRISRCLIDTVPMLHFVPILAEFFLDTLIHVVRMGNRLIGKQDHSLLLRISEVFRFHCTSTSDLNGTILVAPFLLAADQCHEEAVSPRPRAGRGAEILSCKLQAQ